MNPLIIIPVRGGSNGIPRKAIRPLGEACPLVRSIRAATPLGRVVVTTDDPEVAVIASSTGVEVVHESPDLNPRGLRTIDTAVWQVCQQLGTEAEVIATVQCTSPFLETAQIAECLYHAGSGSYDAAVTVRDDRHVAWGGDPLSPELVTPWAVRQALPNRWVLTGGCVASKTSQMTATRRFGGRLRLVPVSGAAAVDLDGPDDWAVAEWYAEAPNLREQLLARVLADPCPDRGLIIVLSAWDEETDDTAFREAAYRKLTGQVLRPREAHTRAEGDVCLPTMLAHESVILLTSAYHQPRAFLTFLKVLQEAGADRRVRLWNKPAASRLDKLPGEWQKVRAYQAQGHVASLEEGLSYLEWRTWRAPCAI